MASMQMGVFSSSFLLLSRRFGEAKNTFSWCFPYPHRLLSQSPCTIFLFFSPVSITMFVGSVLDELRNRIKERGRCRLGKGMDVGGGGERR